MMYSNCVTPNVTGRNLEKLAADSSVCLINPINFFTFISAHTGKRSCLDLCFTSLNLASLTQMSRLSDVGSDHSPICIEINKVPLVVKKCYPKRWVINEDNLIMFAKMMEGSVGDVLYPNDINTKCNDLTDRIVHAAAKTIHKTSGKPIEHKRTCWLSADYSKAVAARKHVHRQLEKYPTEYHACLYKEKAAIAKKICKEAKKASFHNFVENLQFDTPSGVIWKKILSNKLSKILC